jgi:hypothetical protein
VTLVALRAATEPVKEEAMQAIFKVLLCDVKCGCVCWNDVRGDVAALFISRRSAFR